MSADRRQVRIDDADTAPSLTSRRTMGTRRTRRWSRCRLPQPVAPERNDRHRDRMEREDPAAIRAHRLHRRLLLLRPVVSQARRAGRRGLEHPPVPFGDGVLLRLRRLRRAHDRAARITWSARRATRSARPTAPTARPFITTTRKTSTTSRGRRAPISWSVRRRSSIRRCRAVQMRLLLQPEHAGQEARHFASAAAALRYYGEWFGAVPVRPVTIVDPGIPERERRHGISDAIHRGHAMDGARRARSIPRRSPFTKPAISGGTASSAATSSRTRGWTKGINQFSEARADEVALGDRNYPRAPVLRRLHSRGSFTTSA